ncbi:MAG: hypothetical protein NTX76_05950 [Alphaproteobacteria bacterium]|nr:hypothetical protein [Alphaproteobacteria bacterium]
MTLFNNTLSTLMNQRLTWLNAQSKVLTTNIANADNPSAKREELRSFLKILSKSPSVIKSNGISLTRVKNFTIQDNDLIHTNKEIARELETLEMAKNNLEHETLINVVRQFHKMFKAAIGKSQ